MVKENDKQKTDTTKDVSALTRRAERREARGKGAIADWEIVDKETISALIQIVAFRGGTTTFGYTRDGGAYYISFFIDNESIKEYIRPTEDVNRILKEELENWV